MVPFWLKGKVEGAGRCGGVGVWVVGCGVRGCEVWGVGLCGFWLKVGVLFERKSRLGEPRSAFHTHPGPKGSGAY